MGGRSTHSQPPLHRSGPGCQSLSGLMPTWNAPQPPSILFLLQAARVLSPLPWEGLLDAPQAHPDTADWELPLEEEAGGRWTHQAWGFLFTSPRWRLHWEWGLRWYVSCRHSFSMAPRASPSCRPTTHPRVAGAGGEPGPSLHLPALQDHHGHPGLARCGDLLHWLPVAARSRGQGLQTHLHAGVKFL